MNDAFTWFELPARELDRAQRFYDALLDISLHRDRPGSPAGAARGRGERGPALARRDGERPHAGLAGT